MRTAQSHIRVLVLLLSVWLLGAQTLVLAHDATHGVHIHKQFCDDLEAISCNLVAAIADFTLSLAQPLPVVSEALQSRQFSSQFNPAYQSRAPPSFTG